MAKRNEGKDVRVAYDGPALDDEELLVKIGRWNREDHERASSAGETRSDIGQYLEKTGLHPKALSVLRTIKKIEAKSDGQAKAMDLIRSLKAGLAIVEQDISGNSTPDMFDEEPADPLDDDDLDDGFDDDADEALSDDNVVPFVAEEVA